jgi:hypothetical protein
LAFAEDFVVKKFCCKCAEDQHPSGGRPASQCQHFNSTLFPNPRSTVMLVEYEPRPNIFGESAPRGPAVPGEIEEAPSVESFFPSAGINRPTRGGFPAVADSNNGIHLYLRAL